MFREAFVAVQRHPFITRAAVAGFLRDDGTAVCKRMDWKSDELSLYKVVLLNIDELMRLGVEYQRDLMMYEDICLTHQVLRLGGHTLKCQSFCYWAAHASSGGCQDQRKQKSESGTSLFDLMAPAAFRKLCASHQDTVKELHTWVRSKEQISTAKAGAAAATHVQQKAPWPPGERERGEKRPAGEKKSHRRHEQHGRSEAAKKQRDFKAEYQQRKKRRLEKEAAEKEARRAQGLSSSPERERRRRGGPQGGGETRAENSPNGAGGSDGSESSSSSSSSSGDDEDLAVQRFLTALDAGSDDAADEGGANLVAVAA